MGKNIPVIDNVMIDKIPSSLIKVVVRVICKFCYAWTAATSLFSFGKQLVFRIDGAQNATHDTKDVEWVRCVDMNL